MTPVRLHVVAYFSHHFEQKNAKQPHSSNKRVRSQYYGEALTRDEMIQRIENDEREKRERAANKGKGRKRKRKENKDDNGKKKRRQEESTIYAGENNCS